MYSSVYFCFERNASQPFPVCVRFEYNVQLAIFECAFKKKKKNTLTILLCGLLVIFFFFFLSNHNHRNKYTEMFYTRVQRGPTGSVFVLIYSLAMRTFSFIIVLRESRIKFSSTFFFFKKKHRVRINYYYLCQVYNNIIQDNAYNIQVINFDYTQEIRYNY